MPFLRLRSLIILILVVATAATGVLYVIHTRAVHAGPPASLARLTLEQRPWPAPNVSFRDRSGRLIALAALRGRFVLVNLWATWCAPCVRELPALDHLKPVLRSLVIVPINVGHEGSSDTEKFLRNHGARLLPVYIDTESVLIRAFSTEGLPYSAIIDPDGRIIAHAMGPCDWSAPDAIAYLQTLMTSRVRASS